MESIKSRSQPLDLQGAHPHNDQKNWMGKSMQWNPHQTRLTYQLTSHQKPNQKRMDEKVNKAIEKNNKEQLLDDLHKTDLG